MTLSALSLQGTIMMPINKKEKESRNKIKKVSNNREFTLIAAARKGDEEAIESLTLEDMDTYTAISKNTKGRCIYFGRYLFYALWCRMRSLFYFGKIKVAIK